MIAKLIYSSIRFDKAKNLTGIIFTRQKSDISAQNLTGWGGVAQTR
jgi:hypothetical protein